MPIKIRVLIMCLIVAILPALPLTLLVKDLLEKSFNVGLNTTVSTALESGMAVSRMHMGGLLEEFDTQAATVITRTAGDPAKPSRVAPGLTGLAESDHIDGFFVASGVPDRSANPALPGGMAAFSEQPDFRSLIGGATVRARLAHESTTGDLSFFETADKAVQLALWQPPGGTEYLLYRRIDPRFLAQANRILEGNQIFAQLRLTQDALSRSFFYPFIVVYGIVLAVVLALALVMAERMAAPVRRLAAASTEVARGNWQVHLRREIGGEIGRLIDAFNAMVGRLDAQQRRLLDMEKVAGWREMARHLAHEIKNPLLPIGLAVQEMRDQYKGDDAAYEAFLKDSTRIVEDELAHLGGLVKEFSAFARMPGLKPIFAALKDLVADVARLYPQVETHIEADDTLPEFPFDTDQIRRVLVNLFDNAVSVRPDGRQAKVAIRIHRRDNHVAMVFTDNGPGIAAEHIPRVFDPYFTTRTTGTGLGLALTKSIVVMHGGTIAVESPAGGGAAFTVTLPLSGPANPSKEG